LRDAIPNLGGGEKRKDSRHAIHFAFDRLAKRLRHRPGRCIATRKSVRRVGAIKARVIVRRRYHGGRFGMVSRVSQIVRRLSGTLRLQSLDFCDAFASWSSLFSRLVVCTRKSSCGAGLARLLHVTTDLSKLALIAGAFGQRPRVPIAHDGRGVHD